MAEDERKPAKWPVEIVEAAPSAAENLETSNSSSVTNLKSSWSGWFQRMNDALANVVGPEDEEESEEGKKKDDESEEKRATPKQIQQETLNDEKSGEEKDSNPQQKQESSAWGKWGSSFLKQAKEKTMTTLELVKKDLSEFSDVVQNETASIVTNTATTFRERAPGLMGSIVGTVNNVLLVEDTTQGEQDLEVPITADQAASICANRAQARLYAIQTDPGTYCHEPEGAPELFDDWLDHSFNLQERRDEIAQLLVNNPALRNLYVKLVPLEVSNTIFWQRYFYKLHQLELDEARRQALLKREETNGSAASIDDHLRLSWGDESEPDGTLEQVEKAETESFCVLTPDAIADSTLSLSSAPASPPPPPTDAARKTSPPLCGRAPPEGASAIPKSRKGKGKGKGKAEETVVVDSFNVEMEKAIEKDESEQLIDLAAGSASDGEARSTPTDKKSDDWVEWEDNGGTSN